MDLDPTSTAVLAVHLQGDIVTPEGAFAPFFASQVIERNVLAQAANVLSAARDAGATVVYTRVAWAPDYSDLNANSPLLGMVAQNGCLKEGEPLSDIVPEATPQDGDHVVTHRRIGGFSDSELDATLRGAGVTTVAILGVATNASVESTARQASDLGYRVIVIEDACSAATPDAHAATIGSLGLFGEISTVDEVTSALAGA